MSIGETLAQARRRAGLTVAGVSQRTRIRETIIRGIENDDFSACGGDFYARGHIRSIAHTVGADPEPLIWEYDQDHGAPEALTAADAFEPVTPLRAGRRRRVSWPAALALALVVAVGVTGYLLISGSSAVTPAAHVSPPHQVTKQRASHAARPAHRATPKATHAVTHSASPAPPAVAARALTPAGALAFGPGGPGQGDNAPLARFAIHSHSGTAWHTDWYTSARFGNLQRGTGLLLDMGRPVTITSARITLHGAGGTDLQLRTGDRPSLASLRPAARVSGARGVVHLRLTSPAHSRYVLIWITRLPPDSSGTFQVGVSGVRVSGQE